MRSKATEGVFFLPGIPAPFDVFKPSNRDDEDADDTDYDDESRTHTQYILKYL